MALKERASLISNWRTVMSTCSPPKGRVDAVSKWLTITRACVQPMTLTSAAIAGLLAATRAEVDWWLYSLAAVGLVIAHASNNMMNDLFDTSAGLDTDAYPRTLYAPHPVHAGLVSSKGLWLAAGIANALDAAIMVVLFMARGWPILAFALSGLAISFFYTAPPLRLKGRGVGEVAVAVVWGPLMVGGAYYAAVGSLPTAIWWASVPYALLVTTVLMGKHIDKAPWDAPKRIFTLPVLIGEKTARTTTIALMAGFYAAVATLMTLEVLPLWCLTVALALPTFGRSSGALLRPKPQEPPEDYTIWPLWFAPWAFLHARRAGALFVFGLVLDLSARAFGLG